MSSQVTIKSNSRETYSLLHTLHISQLLYRLSKKMDFYTQNKFVEKPDFNPFFYHFHVSPTKNTCTKQTDLTYDRKFSVF